MKTFPLKCLREKLAADEPIYGLPVLEFGISVVTIVPGNKVTQQIQ